MNNPRLSALLPVVVLVMGIGLIAGLFGWILAEATRGLSNTDCLQATQKEKARYVLDSGLPLL